MFKPLCGPFLLVILFLLTPASIKADPVVITSGFLSVSGGIFAGPVYSFAGQGFSASGQGEPGNTGPQQCSPCVGGSLLTLNANFAGSSLGSGTAIINGVSFNNMTFAGQIQFFGSVVLPSIPSDITLTAPFTFNGFMFGCVNLSHVDCSPQVAVFNIDVTGQGLATVQLAFEGLSGSGQPLYAFRSVRYDFQAVPEPSAILLLGGGLVSFVFRWKKRRR